MFVHATTDTVSFKDGSMFRIEVSGVLDHTSLSGASYLAHAGTATPRNHIVNYGTITGNSNGVYYIQVSLTHRGLIYVTDGAMFVQGISHVYGNVSAPYVGDVNDRVIRFEGQVNDAVYLYSTAGLYGNVLFTKPNVFIPLSCTLNTLWVYSGGVVTSADDIVVRVLDLQLSGSSIFAAGNDSHITIVRLALSDTGMVQGEGRIDVEERLDWNGGGFGGTSVVHLLRSCVTESPRVALYVKGRLRNFGTWVYDGSTVYFESVDGRASELTIEADATLLVRTASTSSSSLVVSSGTGATRFVNNGLVLVDMAAPTYGCIFQLEYG